jgi:hypothetical protein
VTALATLISAAVLASCPVSHVHYRSYPGVGAGLAGVPWVATSNGAFYGHLFYLGGTPWGRSSPVGAHIFTTVVRRKVHPKVLWIARRRPATSVLLRGRRIDGRGSFSSTWPGSMQTPSYVEIPSAGCWRVTITEGRSSGSVVFVAVDHF